MPRVGQTIVYKKVPPGSYCTAGVPYRVEQIDRRHVHVRNVERGSGTSDPTWAVRQSVWAEAV